MVGESGGHLHGDEQPAGGANQAKEKTTTDYVVEEARMLEVKTFRSSMELWGQNVSGDD